MYGAPESPNVKSALGGERREMVELATFTAMLSDWLVVPTELVALTVTELTPVAVGVPEMRPVVELIDRPVGRPVAVNEAGVP